MAISSRSYVLEFDPEKRKCRLGQENFVHFKGCVSQDVVQKKVEEQKDKDRANTPPPQPTDRDGYLYCNLGTRTYHYQSTSPPYTDTDLGVPC